MHFGSGKMSHFIKNNFILNKNDRICKKVARSCDLRQRAKIFNRRTEGEWTFNTPSRPNESISLDLFGPLPLSNRGKKYIMVTIDQFSRKICFTATADRCAKTLVKAATRIISKKYTTCKYIITDNAKEFHSHEWKSFGDKHKITLRSTTPYNPQSSLAERTMRDLARIIRSYSYFNHSKWEELLPRIEKTFNSTIHSSINAIPYDITGEEQIQIPAHLGATQNEPEPEKLIKNVQDLLNKIQETRSRRQKKYKPTGIKFKIKDKVLLKTSRLSDKAMRRCKKLNLLYEGPYLIESTKGTNAFGLKRIVGGIKTSANSRRIRPYISPEIPDFSDWDTQESEYESEIEELDMRRLQVNKGATCGSQSHSSISVRSTCKYNSVFDQASCETVPTLLKISQSKNKMEQIQSIIQEISELDAEIIVRLDVAKNTREHLKELINKDIESSNREIELYKENTNNAVFNPSQLQFMQYPDLDINNTWYGAEEYIPFVADHNLNVDSQIAFNTNDETDENHQIIEEEQLNAVQLAEQNDNDLREVLSASRKAKKLDKSYEDGENKKKKKSKKSKKHKDKKREKKDKSRNKKCAFQIRGLEIHSVPQIAQRNETTTRPSVAENHVENDEDVFKQTKEDHTRSTAAEEQAKMADKKQVVSNQPRNFNGTFARKPPKSFEELLMAQEKRRESKRNWWIRNRSKSAAQNHEEKRKESKKNWWIRNESKSAIQDHEELQ